MVAGSIIVVIKDFCIKYTFEICMGLATLLFVVPIVYCMASDWTIPGILIFYDFMFGLIVIVMLLNSTDTDRYNGEHGYKDDGYHSSASQNKTNGYHNPFYDPLTTEKRKNGGLTDKEVVDRKQLIRKKLEKKNILESTKEKVTN